MAPLAFNDRSGIGRSGTATLKVDATVVATRKMKIKVPLALQWYEAFHLGADRGTPVDDVNYRVPFKFAGKTDKLAIKAERAQLKPADIQKLEEAKASASDAEHSRAAASLFLK